MRIIHITALLCILTLPATAQDLPVSASQQKNLGIALQPVAPADEVRLAVLPATLRVPRNARSVVVAPFSGTVTEVAAMEGDRVSAGTRLATIFSRDLLAARAELAQHRLDFKVATADAQRTRALAQDGVIAQSRAEAAAARAAGLQAQVAEHEHLLRGVSIDPRPGYYGLVASAAGRVAAIAVEPGATVEAMANVVTIDKNGTLWADAQLPPQLAMQVKTGLPVQIGTIRGKVISVGTGIDTATRSILVRAEVPPGEGIMPGAIVNMGIMAPSGTSGFAVPRNAVIRVRGKDTVFVRTPTGFRAVPVTVLAGRDDGFLVSGALAAGQRVASSGVSSLKALAEE